MYVIACSDLRNNPFLCDCELRWFPQFLADTRPLILMAGTCNAPASFSGMALDSLTEEQFTCGMIVRVQCHAYTSIYVHACIYSAAPYY